MIEQCIRISSNIVEFFCFKNDHSSILVCTVNIRIVYCHSKVRAYIGQRSAYDDTKPIVLIHGRPTSHPCDDTATFGITIRYQLSQKRLSFQIEIQRLSVNASIKIHMILTEHKLNGSVYIIDSRSANYKRMLDYFIRNKYSKLSDYIILLNKAHNQ